MAGQAHVNTLAKINSNASSAGPSASLAVPCNCDPRICHRRFCMGVQAHALSLP